MYLHKLTDGFVAERVIREWITFYNTDRPHTALVNRTPDEAYFDGKNDESGMIIKPGTP